MKRRTLVFTLLMALFLSPVLLEAQNKVIVPAYFFPYAEDTPGKHNVGPYWSPLIDAAEKYGDRLIVIANPNNGPGSNTGWEKQKYKEAIDKVRAAGGKVIGYVYTCYGLSKKDGNCQGRTDGDIQRDIKNWKDWYNVDGIFFDEAPSNNPNWMKGADQFAGKIFGFDYIVNNFGTIPSRETVYDHGVMRPEIQIVMEQTATYFDSNVSALPNFDYHAGAILYAASDGNVGGRLKKASAKNINWFYITSDGACGNPYDTLPFLLLESFKIP